MNPSFYRRLILGALIAGAAGWLLLPRQFRQTPSAARAAGPAPACEGQAQSFEPTLERPEPLRPKPMGVETIGVAATDPRPGRNGPAVAGAAGLGGSDRDWPRDPFFRFSAPQPAGSERGGDSTTAAPPLSRYCLRAILTGNSPRALINQQIVAVGDQLPDGSTVTAIDQDCVKLSGPRGPWELKLPE